MSFSPLSDIDTVLFDLGGVVVELTGVGTMIEWSGGKIDEEEVWHRWLHSESVRSFESGNIGIEEFGRQIVEELRLIVPPEEFLQGFGSWIGGLYQQTGHVISSLRNNAGLRVGCLSNTNPLHWEIMTTQFGIHQLFHQHFLSFEIGMMKPDREMFEHVVEVIGGAPERILYFDDNRLNVESARESGMQSYHVRGMEEAQGVLERKGLIRTGSLQ